jgi:release factor glutamine methyltransferase
MTGNSPLASTALLDIRAALMQLRQELAAVSDTPSLDAQTLLGHILGRPRAWLLAHPGASLTPKQARTLAAAAARVAQGEPLPYVIGRWEFFGLDFTVSPQVLIPRPETELLVETGLAWLRAHPGRQLAADVGTGSGCIAISLVVNQPDLAVLATDISRPALQVSAANASRHAVSKRVWFLQADLLPPLARKFDLICANLPYIPSETLQKLKVFQREPTLALDGGPTGLSPITRIIQSAAGQLAPGGLLLLEIEAFQGEASFRLARQAFPQADIRVLPDLAGNDRLLSVRLPA